MSGKGEKNRENRGEKERKLEYCEERLGLKKNSFFFLEINVPHADVGSGDDTRGGFDTYELGDEPAKKP